MGRCQVGNQLASTSARVVDDDKAFTRLAMVAPLAAATNEGGTRHLYPLSCAFRPDLRGGLVFLCNHIRVAVAQTVFGWCPNLEHAWPFVWFNRIPVAI